ncbi:MAG: hypothetical protein AMJ46_14190 [Latescibacteria bacterium DG_63]|nr:MAG: hypothetical protein AMJ46_14190 [Latescibacteria bacterium DG_63]
MGIYVVYAKKDIPNLPKVIVVREPVRELDTGTGVIVTTKQGLRVPRDGGVTYPVSKEDADFIKGDKHLNSILHVKWLEHLDPNTPAKVVNAAVGKDLDAETKGKMAKAEVEDDSKRAKGSRK